MKKLIEEVSGEGLESLLGENVIIWCQCYIYSGKLIGVNTDDLLLDNAKVVYNTGPLDGGMQADAQPLPTQWYIRISKIESYGKLV